MEHRTTWESAKKHISKRKRRSPEESLLYRLVYQYRDELEWCWAASAEATAGPQFLVTAMNARAEALCVGGGRSVSSRVWGAA